MLLKELIANVLSSGVIVVLVQAYRYRLWNLRLGWRFQGRIIAMPRYQHAA
jgi:hypothetical protein